MVGSFPTGDLSAPHLQAGNTGKSSNTTTEGIKIALGESDCKVAKPFLLDLASDLKHLLEASQFELEQAGGRTVEAFQDPLLQDILLRHTPPPRILLLTTTSINLSPTFKRLKIKRGGNAPTSKRTSKRLPTQRTNIQASLWESFQAIIFQVLQMFVLPAVIVTRRGMPLAPTLPPCRRGLVGLLNPRSLWSY
jgi:hypothetical protein